MAVLRKIALVVSLIGAVVILSALATVGLAQSKARPALAFTCVAKPEVADQPEEFTGAIFVMDGSTWRRVDLPAEPYEMAGWEYAGRAKSKPEVWAVAQFGRGDIGPELAIAHSLDDGRAWQHYALEKESRFARFESLSMSRNGRGSLTIRLEDSPEPEHRDGYYTYSTRNNGRTWSKRPLYSKTAPKAAPGILEALPILSSGMRCSEPPTQNP